ncbi:MAG TPA: hypothetical protein VGP07_05800 [Polyangia bacterium]|jgi:hypothetical protein
MLLHHIFDETWPGAFRWWVGLCLVTLVNVCAWAFAALLFKRRRGQTHPETYDLRRTQLILSAVFVLVCGFRSVFPRADVQRICLHDSWLSSVGVGRSLATIAELCFIAQWAILLRELGESTRTRLAITVSRLLIPMIVVAECCSWFAVLTTCYAGNAIEESIWALSATLATASAVAVWPRLSRPHRLLLAPAIVMGAVYVLFMCTVDVPMYISRFIADQARGRHYLSLMQGVRDASLRWVATDSWDEWHTEMPWMTLYFSVVVWVSIALMHVPRFAVRSTTSTEPAFTRPSRLRGPTSVPNAGKV